MKQTQLIETLESIVAMLGRLPLKTIAGACLFLGAAVSIYLIAVPLHAIELQKRFYLTINWRIEPVSLEREIRNTRLMGIALDIALFSLLLFALSFGLL